MPANMPTYMTQDPSMMGAAMGGGKGAMSPQGGDDFEAAFANLAFSVLQSESPSLIDYLLGFELIDKNDEETHAVGIFGFKVGKQLLYAPVFFVNGQLKGNELMYVHNMDVFVPRTDEWVQYLLNRRPYILGEPEMQDESALGISSPNLNRFSESPTSGPRGFLTKFNSAKPGAYNPKYAAKWAKDSVGMFQWEMGKYAGLVKLQDFIKDTADYGTSEILARTLRKSAAFREAFISIYPDIVPFLVKRSAEAQYQVKDNDQPSAKNVKVIFSDEAAHDIMLTENDREQLMRKKILVKDHRTNTSKVYKADVGANLTNPVESGVYEVLVQGGKFEKAHIFLSPKVIGPGKCNVALLISPEDGKPWGYYYPRDLWVRAQDHGDEEKLYSKGTSVEDMEIGAVYMLVSEDGDATEPFRVLRKNSNSQDKSVEIFVRAYEDSGLVKNRWGVSDYIGGAPLCCNPSYRHGERPEPFVGTQYCSFYESYPKYPTKDSYDPEKEFWYQGRKIVYSSEDTARKIRTVGTATIVPPTYKAVRLDNEGDKDLKWGNQDPGSLAELTMEIIKTGGVIPLTVINDGLNYHLTAGRRNLEPMSKRACLKSLIIDFGMREDDAQAIVKEAGKKSYLVKTAISSPGFQDPPVEMDSLLGVPAVGPYEQTEPIPGMEPGEPEDGDPLMDQHDLDMARNGAMAAAQLGQQDIFDTSVMSGLVKAVKVDSVIDKYLSDMILGLDRVGRILFMFYWHNDKFADRYGKEDLIEMEDSLRNVFEGLGELILFLKQRSVSEPIESGTPNIDLSELL